jgi:hypothetical protein
MRSLLTKHLSYANVAATLALVMSTSGVALAAHHYLINSSKQINPSVLRKLHGKPGKAGPTGASGAAGKEGGEGSPGKQGAQGPGASELVVNAAATTSPSFARLGSVSGITFEDECKENAGTHEVTLKVQYTSTVSIERLYSQVGYVNNGPTFTELERNVAEPTASPQLWVQFSAQASHGSSETFEGNLLAPKLIDSESIFVAGGPVNGRCEAAIGLTPAT